MAIGIPGFFLALGPDTRRFRPGFVRRVLTFAIPAGAVSAAAVMVGYGLARAENVSPVKARTAATIVFLVVALWILVIQARPLRMWKAALIATMVGLSVLAFAFPVGRRFYDVALPSLPAIGQVVLLGVAAAAAVEALSRVGRRWL